MNLILYDGGCGLCHRFVRFVLPRDREGSFRFAALQGAAAVPLLETHGKDPADLDTVYVVIGYEEPSPQLLERADAVLFVLRQLGWPWRAFAVLSILPRALRDAAYRRVAAGRYRIFGRSETCDLPSPAHRDRFLDG